MVHMMEIKRGDVVLADLSPVIGSEQGGVRPVVIIQNDMGNEHAPTVIVAAITAQQSKAKLPTHVEIRRGHFGLPKNSLILLEQIRTIDKSRLQQKIGRVSLATLDAIDHALIISLGLA